MHAGFDSAGEERGSPDLTYATIALYDQYVSGLESTSA